MTVNFVNEIVAKRLTKNDNCDHGQCPAFGAVAVQYQSGGWLVFCGHHFDSNPSVLDKAVYVMDSRKLVTA